MLSIAKNVQEKEKKDVEKRIMKDGKRSIWIIKGNTGKRLKVLSNA